MRSLERIVSAYLDLAEDRVEPLVKQIEDWINTYPRGIFGGKTSEHLFNLELENLGINSFS